ncbi:glycosyltransferase [Nocardioides sp. SYSU DS0651]|uniref:glycosyltransferase n=1 Tax=Nocardioides sp. SYSU DS0651 TaxID=3415955 RepID=UPI003F4C29C3
MNRIGDQLVSDGRIDRAQLQTALDRQRAVGGYLGQHLLEAGGITRGELHAALAHQWHLHTRNLDTDPPEGRFTGLLDIEETIALGWVPCEMTDDGTLVVATSVRPDVDLVEEVRDRFPGSPVSFVACTRRDLDHLAARVRQQRGLLGSTDEAPADHAPAALVSHLLVAALGATVGLTAVALVPAGLLAGILVVLGPLFLLAVALQCGTALRVAARERASQPSFRSEPDRADAVLPVYSVLVPVPACPDAVRRVVRNLASLDYPTSRLDAVLLVAEDDERTLAAVRLAAPPDWVRVAAVPRQRLRHPALACDDGLTLARGRYVVAYAADEVPAPDQLRRAVRVFESDLAESLERFPDRTPLAGLRVRHRDGSRRGAGATGGAVLDDALALHRAGHGPGSDDDLRRHLTSTHYNTAVLRRLGGWTVAVALGSVWAEPGVGPRMRTLPSTSCRSTVPGVDGRLRRRADEIALAVRIATARARAAVLGVPFRGDVPLARRVIRGFTMPAMFLAYPVLLAATAAFAARVGVEDSAVSRFGLAGSGSVVLALALAVVVGSALGAMRCSWTGCLHALLVPLHWLLHAAAAWYAVIAVLPRDAGPSPATQQRGPSGRASVREDRRQGPSS